MEKQTNRTLRSGKYIKFIAYAAAVILLNMAGMTLFARIDLTGNHIYSLSKASRDAVKSLSEPLTLHVFFTRNLPAPHNSTERYLHDLLAEYAVSAGKNFNYRFYDVSPDDGTPQSAKIENQKLAESYGVQPVQIQAVENDEVKFQKAYMGMVLIHGDLVERIPAITSTDGLEYQITTAVQKLTNKVSVLLGLKDSIQVRLYKSSSLDAIAPYMGLKTLPQLGTDIESLVKKLNNQLYGKLSYAFLDPSVDPKLESDIASHQIMSLKWPELSNGKIPAGQGAIGLVMQYGEKSVSIPLLQVIQIPIIGTQYQLADMSAIEEAVNQQVETLIGINETIGYLADHGTANLYGSPMGRGQQGAPEDVDTFRTLVSKTYSFKDIQLKDQTILDGFNCLVIAGPTKPFSDYDLFQIDQYLMKGKNLAIFLDAFKEGGSQQNMYNPQGPQNIPLNTGLEKLLEHYGVSIKPVMVMDENSFKQQVPQQYGGGERNIYFAPLIKNEQINKDYPFMKPIKGLVAYKMSPLVVDNDKLAQNGVKANLLFSSSPKSWEMKAPLNLNPLFIQPPAANEKMAAEPLAYILEGEFPSYFAGKPIPEKPQPDKSQKEPDEADELENPEKKPAADTPAAPADVSKSADLSKIEGDGKVISKGKPGKIFLMASSEMLKDNILDEAGRSPNAVFILNVLDYLNNHQDIATMRSKEQRFNPLADLSPLAKTGIKSLNIAGLPVLVVLAGLVVWLRRKSRRRQIQLLFQKQEG
ncbi:MAG: Gldg family protein [Deltaproteobacteria bacterium]|nr:Gldg family protein [Deltaproteobacteria bacterium]